MYSFIASPEFVADDRMLITGLIFGRRAERYQQGPAVYPDSSEK